MSGEHAGGGADRDLVGRRVELVAGIPGGALFAREEGLSGVDGIGGAARDTEASQNQKQSENERAPISGAANDSDGGRNQLRKFPAHPRDSQDKTPQEDTRWKD
jgi:hypothetical protein